MLEVRVLHLAHDTAPPFLGIEQVAFIIDIGGVQVVWATFVGIEREVEGLYGVGFSVCEFASGEYFLRSYLADIRVGLLFQVVFDIPRSERGVLVGEHAVDVIPVQQRAVFAIFDVV